MDTKNWKYKFINHIKRIHRSFNLNLNPNVVATQYNMCTYLFFISAF